MGTLCKNCPFKNAKKEEGRCTDLFVKKFHNSCVTYDIVEDKFMEELEEFIKNKNNTKQTLDTKRIESNDKEDTVVEKTKIIEEIKTETYDENIISN